MKQRRQKQVVACPPREAGGGRSSQTPGWPAIFLFWVGNAPARTRLGPAYPRHQHSLGPALRTGSWLSPSLCSVYSDRCHFCGGRHHLATLSWDAMGLEAVRS